MINAEFLNCPIELSVDGHNITVISSDGYDLEPITGKSFYLFQNKVALDQTEGFPKS